MANINFFFTVECPHCGKLFEVNHLAIEVLFNSTDLGICKHCGLMVTAHLTSRAADGLMGAAKKVVRRNRPPLTQTVGRPPYSQENTMEELTVTEIDEIVIIEKMHAMCEESCSPDQFEEWEKLKAHLMVTRRNLRTAQQGVQLTAADVESDGENQDSGGN